MTEQVCPKCKKMFKAGDQVCSYCGFVLPFATDTLAPGSILQSRYEIQKLLHSGGMGYVYLALDKKLQRQCVVKQVKERAKSETHLKKLEAEALQMAKLSYTNVAMVLDHFVEEPYYYLVVEYISGKTLSQLYDEHHGQLNEEEVIKWAVAICDVVSYMHRKGVIHRDISPDNIMVTEEGFIKLVDFGTMRELSEIVTGRASKEGKFGFTAPEQWEGKPVPQSDIFSIGATIYYLLTGYLPLSKEYQSGGKAQTSDYQPDFPPLRTKNPEVSLELQSVLQKALQTDINERYSTTEGLRQALEGLKKVRIRKEAVASVSVDSDYLAAVPSIQAGKPATKRRLLIRTAVALLIIGFLAFWFVIAMAISFQDRASYIPVITVSIVFFILPFLIPGVLCLRKGITQDPHIMSAKGSVPHWWWSLPTVLGFIGGIISWVKQKDVNRRKAMNMLTLGIIATFVWIIPVSVLQFPPNMLSIPNPTPSPYSPPTTTGWTIKDDFSNSNGGWCIDSSDWGKFDYEGGEYSVSTEVTAKIAFCTNTVRGMLEDFTVEVDARKLSQGTDDAAGIIFREQKEQDKESYYVFWLSSSDGSYCIQKCIKSVWAPNLKDFTPSNYINRGANSNRLKVVCKGSQIEVYANEHLLTTVTDTSLTSGYIGLAVATWTSANAHYHFDNFIYTND